MKFALTVATVLASTLSFPALADHPLGGLGLGTAGPITTISASTLPQGKFAVAYQVEHMAFKEFSDAQLSAYALQGIDAHSVKSNSTHSLRLAYGLSDDLSIGFKLPYVTRQNVRGAHFHVADNEVELHRMGDSEGLGDVTALGQYRFLKGGATEAAVLFGVKAPTGDTSTGDALGGTFEADHLPGGGAWDGLIGAALTQRYGALSVDANLLYTLAGKGTQATKLGDRLAWNIGLSYRLGAAAHDHGHAAAAHSHLSWDLVFELNGERQQPVEVAGAHDPNTGGTVVYAAPGVRLSGERWSAFASYGTPVHKRLDGIQHEPDYRFVAGVAFGF